MTAIAEPQITPKELGRAIKTLRTWADLTLRELSTATGIPVSSLSRYENGQRWPSLLHLQLIAAALGVDSASLLSSPGDLRAFANSYNQIAS